MTELNCCVVCESSTHVSLAKDLASRLDAPFFLGVPLGAFEFTLAITPERVELRTAPGDMGPTYVDFLGGVLGYRVRKRNQSQDLVVRALGGRDQKILDLTIGLGADAFVLARHGCEITGVERSEVVCILLEDGLRRGLADPKTSDACGRIRLRKFDAFDFFKAPENSRSDWDAVYIDPMFPLKSKTALPKKELQVLQRIVGLGNEDESRRLLSLAGQHARRVVVKRPSAAPPLLPEVSSSLKGRSVRFDVYLFS